MYEIKGDIDETDETTRSGSMIWPIIAGLLIALGASFLVWVIISLLFTWVFIKIF